MSGLSSSSGGGKGGGFVITGKGRALGSMHCRYGAGSNCGEFVSAMRIVNVHHGSWLISICRPSRTSFAKPSIVVPRAWHARLGLTGLT